MSKNKTYPLVYQKDNVNRYALITRWNTCQGIARMLYLRRLSDAKLEEMLNKNTDAYEQERRI